MGGRQWERTETGRYKLNRYVINDHNCRQEMPGCLGSKLNVERKLEGSAWNGDKPNTEIRSFGDFASDLFPPRPAVEKSDDDKKKASNVDDDDVEKKAEQQKPCWTLLKAAVDLKNRHAWDAAVVRGTPIRRLETDDQMKADFEQANPFESFLQSRFHHTDDNDDYLNKDGVIRALLCPLVFLQVHRCLCDAR